ncbi:putative RhoGAP domain [Monocercomonoides exilis]|uniref:putative RhoGAP domain n=1 Tax=Monocercomonoides exilis TaxID=2049356 RepID=UPI00355A2F7D|nr:putative RhoGAP domain [Monocercomonoides exilis]|eukprot:MONOS_9529.1-p1 / transcript=MONOS_9529.1 / gene=MONOS_9529 / organism=Monocercomonoides_exilis_PA203 / gene_product=unspecified product / transcript_product=unspecified product / location=Mono_scaffold00396:52276-54583(-) / protein_length=731 / sequence_SO=supercontig / SO=protein_coding / is_pseudo=false
MEQETFSLSPNIEVPVKDIAYIAPSIVFSDQPGRRTIEDSIFVGRPDIIFLGEIDESLDEKVSEHSFTNFAKELFTTHTKGFNKVIPLAKLLTHSTEPLKKALLRMPDLNHEFLKSEGKAQFMDLLCIMKDAPAKFSIKQHVNMFITRAVKIPELRDESICQILRQVSDNPSTESTLIGWRLMSLLLSCILPTPKLEPCLINAINTQQQVERRILKGQDNSNTKSASSGTGSSNSQFRTPFVSLKYFLLTMSLSKIYTGLSIGGWSVSVDPRVVAGGSSDAQNLNNKSKKDSKDNAEISNSIKEDKPISLNMDAQLDVLPINVLIPRVFDTWLDEIYCWQIYTEELYDEEKAMKMAVEQRERKEKLRAEREKAMRQAEEEERSKREAEAFEEAQKERDNSSMDEGDNLTESSKETLSSGDSTQHKRLKHRRPLPPSEAPPTAPIEEKEQTHAEEEAEEKKVDGENTDSALQIESSGVEARGEARNENEPASSYISDNSFEPRQLVPPLHIPLKTMIIPQILAVLCNSIVVPPNATSKDITALFAISGNPSQVAHAKKMANTGNYFVSEWKDANTADDSGAVPATTIATLLKNWLRGLSEPLIPAALHKRIRNSESAINTCTIIETHTPNMNFYTLKYLIRFLRRMAFDKAEAQFLSNVTQLAYTFAPLLFHPDADKSITLKDFGLFAERAKRAVQDIIYCLAISPDEEDRFRQIDDSTRWQYCLQGMKLYR